MADRRDRISQQRLTQYRKQATARVSVTVHTLTVNRLYNTDRQINTKFNTQQKWV